jgi:hypothetical protein
MRMEAGIRKGIPVRFRQGPAVSFRAHRWSGSQHGGTERTQCRLRVTPAAQEPLLRPARFLSQMA